MAPTWQGQVLDGICSNCGQVEELSADSFNPEFPIRCFKCGGVAQIQANLGCLSCGHRTSATVAGPHVTRTELGLLSITDCEKCNESMYLLPSPGQLVETVPATSRAVDRLDTIVFNHHGNRIAKRVWGLAGEKISIRNGDLLISGQVFRKSLVQACRLAVPVNRLGDGSQRWRVVTNTSASTLDFATHGGEASPGSDLANKAEGYTRQLKKGSSPRDPKLYVQLPLRLPASQILQWTYLKPATGVSDKLATAEWLVATQLDDDLPSNQGLSYLPSPVSDFILHMVFDNELRTATVVRCNYGSQKLEFNLVPPLTSDTNRQSPAKLMVATRREVVLAYIDRQVFAKSDVNSLRIPSEELHWVASQSLEGCAKIEIEACGGDVEIQSLSVYRDLHLRPADPWFKDQGPLQAWIVPDDSFFVLGDNPPVSEDSRNGLGMIPTRELIGVLKDPASEIRDFVEQQP